MNSEKRKHKNTDDINSENKKRKIDNIINCDSNIIQKILENKNEYVELNMKSLHLEHFLNNMDEYEKVYKTNIFWTDNNIKNFTNLIKYAFTQNTHIDSLHISKFVIFSWMNIFDTNKYNKIKSNKISEEFVYDVLSIRKFKSIYIGDLDYFILKYLNENKNDNLQKIQLSMFFGSIEYNNMLEQVIMKSESIRHLDLKYNLYSNFEYKTDRSYYSKRLNIEQLTLKFAISSFVEDPFFGSKRVKILLKNKYIKRINMYSEYFSKYKTKVLKCLKKNYTLVNFLVNDKHDKEIDIIMDRNRKYIMTILLCMNRRKVPRCIFRELILVNL